MDFRTAANQYAQQYGIPPGLFARLVQQESSWRPDAVSSAGAIGLAQLMPGTARELGVNPQDPLQNLEGGARYLRQQYDRFGSWPLALAAYNAGPSRVASAGGIPNIAETQNYVSRVWGGFNGDTGDSGMIVTPATTSPTAQPQPQGLFGGIGQGLRNMFGGGQPDPNAGSATDPFEGLSRSQRTMLGFAALRDAAASLEGRDSNFFNEALGGFEAARERERLRAQGQFANRNNAINNLIQLEALASQLPENSGLQQLVNTQRELLLGQVGLPSGTSVTGMAGAGGATPMPVDFTGGATPTTGLSTATGPIAGDQYLAEMGRTGSIGVDAQGNLMPEATAAPAPAAAPAAAPDDPIAQFNAQIAEQERIIDGMIGNLPNREDIILGEVSGLQAGVSPQEQALLDQAIGRRDQLIAQRDAFVAGQPDREAAALASEDAARQARYNRSVIQSIINSPNLGGVVGRFEGQTEPGTAGGAVLFDESDLDLIARIDQLEGQVFLEARDMLRGGGQITDFEGIRAQEALSRIGQRGVSEEAYRQALRELDQVFANAEARALGQPVPFPDINTDPNAGGATGGAGGAGGATHRYNPQTGQIEAIR